LLFRHFYASGARSDKGLVSILSGYPALPNSSIMIFPNKTQLIPGLAKSLTEEGYSSAFYYGGDINFASMKSYMLNCGFQKIVSQSDFSTEENVMSWGVADEFLFNRVYKEIASAEKPFFKAMFTLSSHPPYDIPAKPWKQGKDRETLYINSIHYTDSCIGNFVRKLETSGLLENTLLIFVADHGNGFPGNSAYSAKEKFQIPMIWFGSALNESGVVNHIASQTDIPKTLLEQMQLNSDAYIFSRNIFGDSYYPESMFAFNNGFGYVNDSLDYSYNQSDKSLVLNSGKSGSGFDEHGKKFYQALHDNFLKLK
jgi:phosphoglycerol transferase MdoB-like AlkP superfamily enzyme